MEIYTKEELIEQIKAIDSSIADILTAQKYTKETGQSNQSVEKANLNNMRSLRREIMARLDKLNGSSGVQFVNVNFN